MKIRLFPSVSILFICVAFMSAAPAAQGDSSPQERTASFHAGFLYPNGVDVAGYTVEHGFKYGFYGYYTFGLPSLAAAGISYYGDYEDNGVTATIGVGIGSVLYSSLAYQLRFADKHFVKLGAGYVTGIAYTGVYPVLSYEFRFK